MPSINYVMDLEEEIRNLRTKIKIMGEQNERLEKVNEDLKSKLDTDLAICRIKQLEDANNVLEKEINELKKQNYTLGEKCREETRVREHWRQLCNERADRIRSLDNEKEDLKQQLDTECKKKQDLQEQLDNIGKTYCETARRVGELAREKGNLQRQLDSLNTAMGRLRERYEEEVVCRRKWAKLAGYRDKRIEELLKTGYGIDADEVYKLKGMEELWAMIREVNRAPIEALYDSGAFNNKVCVGTMVDMYPDVRDFIKEYKAWKGCAEELDKYIQQLELQDSVHKNCYDQGQTDLWVKLQDVKDMQPNEFDVECECLGDVIDMDLEDFLDAYKKWWEEKEKEETERMRKWLSDFCVGRVCKECPLGSDEFKCGNGYSFNRYGRFDHRIIPDEDLKRYYEKARDWVKKEEEKLSDEEVPCSFGWKLDGTEFSIETSIPRKDYDNIAKIISGKE